MINGTLVMGVSLFIGATILSIELIWLKVKERQRRNAARLHTKKGEQREKQ